MVSPDFLSRLSSRLWAGISIIAAAFIILSIVVGIIFYKQRQLLQASKVTVTDRKRQERLSSTTVDPRVHGVSLSQCFHSHGLQVSTDEESELQGALQKHKQRKLELVMTSVTSDVSDTSSNVESTNLDQRSLSSLSLCSFRSQSLEACREWFSDEEGSLCSSSMSDIMSRVQVYLETMDDSPNFQKFPCDRIVCEDQKYLGLEKTNQQKMQMPQSLSDPLEASFDILLPPPQPGPDASGAPSGISPPPLLPGADASGATSGILPPPLLPGADASGATSGIHHLHHYQGLMPQEPLLAPCLHHNQGLMPQEPLLASRHLHHYQGLMPQKPLLAFHFHHYQRLMPWKPLLAFHFHHNQGLMPQKPLLAFHFHHYQRLMPQKPLLAFHFHHYQRLMPWKPLLAFHFHHYQRLMPWKLLLAFHFHHIQGLMPQKPLLASCLRHNQGLMPSEAPPGTVYQNQAKHK
ncbi:uncharacterized protein C1orf185 homolog isoform X2 [Phascolarctos cinereus]